MTSSELKAAVTELHGEVEQLERFNRGGVARGWRQNEPDRFQAGVNDLLIKALANIAERLDDLEERLERVEPQPAQPTEHGI